MKDEVYLRLLAGLCARMLQTISYAFGEPIHITVVNVLERFSHGQASLAELELYLNQLKPVGRVWTEMKGFVQEPDRVAESILDSMKTIASLNMKFMSDLNNL